MRGRGENDGEKDVKDYLRLIFIPNRIRRLFLRFVDPTFRRPLWFLLLRSARLIYF